MSTRTPGSPANARAGRDTDTLRAARARRNAWVLGLLALAFYVGFMVYTAIEGPR